MAISLIFDSTDIVSTLKMPKPARRMISETVIAADIAQGEEELQICRPPDPASFARRVGKAFRNACARAGARSGSRSL